MPNKLSLAPTPCRWHLCISGLRSLSKDMSPLRDPSFGAQHSDQVPTDIDQPLPFLPPSPPVSPQRCPSSSQGGGRALVAQRNGIQGLCSGLSEAWRAWRAWRADAKLPGMSGLSLPCLLTGSEHTPRSQNNHTQRSQTPASAQAAHTMQLVHPFFSPSPSSYNSQALLSPCLLTRQQPHPPPPPPLILSLSRL